MSIRWEPDQRRKLRAAVRALTKQRPGERVKLSEIIRTGALRYAEEILKDQATP